MFEAYSVEVDLVGENWDGVNSIGADLVGADLVEVNLVEADLVEIGAPNLSTDGSRRDHQLPSSGPGGGRRLPRQQVLVDQERRNG